MSKPTTNDNIFIDEITNITNDRTFKKFFKENITSPVSSYILNEIYPYVYLSILMVIISFLLILSIFVLLVRQFSVLNMLISKQYNNISDKK